MRILATSDIHGYKALIHLICMIFKKQNINAGLLAYGEIDDVFGLTDIVACQLRDNRIGKNTQHCVTALFHLSVRSHLAHFEDTNGIFCQPYLI